MVAVIVAVLAVVAGSLMMANKRRAIMTEAETGLGLLRMSLRTLYAESGAYDRDRSGATLIVAGSVTNIPGVNTNDLSGHWFNAPAYDLQAVSSNAFTVRCQGSQSTASNSADVAGLVVTLDESGNFVRTGY